MSSGRAVVVLALAVVALLAVALALSAGGGAAGSTLSRGPDGWWAARRYAEARGVESELVDRAARFREAPDGATLVVVFPVQRPLAPDVADAVGDHLLGGGHVLFAYSGGEPSASETRMAAALGVALRPARPPAPLGPAGWHRHRSELWELAPAEAGAGPAGGPPRPLVLPAQDWAPRRGTGAPPGDPLYRRGSGIAPAFQGRGRRAGLTVIPAAALANGRLAASGNVDLLEALCRRLPSPWLFDELHHGLVAAVPAAEDGRVRRVADLVLAQVALLYLLAAVTAGRRFGPPWREAPTTVGSTASFLTEMGRLHHRLGHHGEAARRLVARRRRLRGEAVDDAGPAVPVEGGDAEGLLLLARDLAEGGRDEERRRG